LIEFTQYRSQHFQGSISWLGVVDDAAFVGEPQGNGVAEPFMRTLKERCLWSQLFEDVDDLRQGVAAFIDAYNDEWLIERLGRHARRSARQWPRRRRDSHGNCPTQPGARQSPPSAAGAGVAISSALRCARYRARPESGRRISPT